MQNDILASNIKQCCNERNISLNALIQTCGLSKSFIYDLEKRNSSPSCDKLQKIADFLNCSVDYLLGRATSSTEINSHNTISGNNNIIGNGNSIGERLSEQETALLDIFKRLNVIKQAQLLSFAAELEKEV